MVKDGRGHGWGILGSWRWGVVGWGGHGLRMLAFLCVTSFSGLQADGVFQDEFEDLSSTLALG